MSVCCLDEKRRIIEFYEKLRGGYVDLYLMESLMGYLGLLGNLNPRNKIILDVGCGVGVGAGLFSGVASLYICLDIACGVLKYPSRLPWVDTVCADGSMLPMRSSSIDIAVLLNVVNADLDGELIVKEAIRVSNTVLARSPRDIDNMLIARVLGNTLKRGNEA